MDVFKVLKSLARLKAKHYILAAAIGVVVFVFIGTLWYYVPVMGSGESAYCARCHSMKPEYLTWRNSTHAQFQCQECHKQSGVVNFFKYQGRIFTEIFFFRTGGRTMTSAMKEPIPNSVCLKCHSENRRYSPSSDTVIPHSKHQAKGISCVTCHAGLAHGRIVERGVTARLPAEDWNEDVAREQVDFQYSTPRMALCLDCHGKRAVNQTCSVCHSRQIVPATHKPKSWEQQHGISAGRDFKPCNLCHSYSMKSTPDLNAITLRDYIKTNTFCFNCHLQKPSTHKSQSFEGLHGQLAKSRGMGNCLGCHDVKAKGPDKDRGPINKVYCNKCHWFQ